MPANHSGSARAARIASCLALVCVAAAAEGQPVPEAPATPASDAPAPAATPTQLLRSTGSFFSNFKLPGAAAAAPDSPPSAVDEASSGVALHPIDIDKVSKFADVVVDPECKTLVQPFGTMDSAASLGLLAAKMKLMGFVGKLGVDMHAPSDPKQFIKLAARQLNWLPTPLELRLGEALVPETEILPEDKNRESRRLYEQARGVLAEIVKDLPQPLPYDFRVLVRTTSYGNATALPGGIILVDRNLFRNGVSPEYVYFVMSHEVAHVLQRHQTRAYQARLTDGIDTLESLGSFLKTANSPDVAGILPMATSLKRLAVEFTEDQELQADSCAIRMMAKRYPDSAVLQDKLRDVEQQLGPIAVVAPEGPRGGGIEGQLRYLSDGVTERHPDGVRRRNNLHATFQVLQRGK